MQERIAQELNINRQLVKGGESKEIQRRIDFIKTTLLGSGSKALVLGISGGVDSLTAGRLCQLAVEQLRDEDYAARFIAMRLPYKTQADESDAQASLDFITPDQIDTLNIAASVDGLMASLTATEASATHVDFIKGNVKARARMIAQYAVANLHNGLVVGTDHGAEALMGFFTKFGDGACDLAPLSGLVKGQVRQIAKRLGAPAAVFSKVPTADLEDERPGIPDEQVHGVSYADIDAFLQGKPVSDTAYQAIVQTYDKTQHKRELPLVP